jgi:hypothetical protein
MVQRWLETAAYRNKRVVQGLELDIQELFSEHLTEYMTVGTWSELLLFNLIQWTGSPRGKLHMDGKQHPRSHIHDPPLHPALLHAQSRHYLLVIPFRECGMLGSPLHCGVRRLPTVRI